MPDEHMCTRAEVEHIVENSTRDLHGHIQRLEEKQDALENTREEKMSTIAEMKVTNAVTGLVKWVGVSGVVGVVGAIWFFAGLNSDVQHLHDEIGKLNTQLEELDDFMNRGDRFTSTDGTELRTHSDNRDELLQKQIDDNQEEMKAELKSLRDEIISEIRSLR